MNVLALCAGVGGIELGLRIAEPGARCIAYVEREAYAAAALVARMEEGWLDQAPIWSDLGTFDPQPWRGVVDCIVSGDPCQPNSLAGKRQGSDDDRWLIERVLGIVDAIRPARFFRENVPGNADGQLEALTGPLERMGYGVAAGLFSAAEVGADESDYSSWPTTTVQDDNASGSRNLEGSNAHQGTSLTDKIQMWPAQWETPGVALTEGSRRSRSGDRSTELLLTGQAEKLSTQWPTPRTISGGPESGGRKQELGRTESGGGDLQSEALAFSPQDRPIPDGPKSSAPRRSLNPLFVEWLMGWPRGWSTAQIGSGPAETEWCRWLRLSRGALYRLCLRRAPKQGSLF